MKNIYLISTEVFHLECTEEQHTGIIRV